MSNYRYTSDLMEDVLFRCGEATDGGSDYDGAALRYLNRAYQGICMGGSELDPTVQEDWWWLRSTTPGVILMQPMISAGTVAVTHSFEFATFTAAPFPAFGTLDGWFFRTSGSPDISRVVDQVGNVVEFDQVYSGPTSSATTYELRHLEYALVSDTLRLIHPMRTFLSGERYEVLGIDMSAMDRDWPLSRVVAGLPSHYAHVSELLIRFNRSGPTDDEDLFRVEYDYLIRPDDLVDSPTQEPVVPRQWRRVLSDWASFWILMDKNDDRADAVGLSARNGLAAMARENRHRMGAIGRGAVGQIRPRQDGLDRFSGPIRTSSGLIIG
jgi:hypothetical protein